MIDLLLHQGSSFVPLGETTEDENVIMAQAYIGLFLTEIGSVDIEPELGIDLKLGKSNLTNVRLKAQEVNHDILEEMATPYSLRTIKIVSLSQVNDYIKMTVQLIKENGEAETVSVSF